MTLLVRPGLSSSGRDTLGALLDPALRLGISTPGADPSGDYALEVFARAEALRPGAGAALAAKALRLIGGAGTPTAPPGQDPYAWVLERGAADLFLTYRTNAHLARAALPAIGELGLPDALQVAALYGRSVRHGRPAAERLALFILSNAGQMILRRHGFDPPDREDLDP